MVPIVIDPQRTKIGLAGEGEARARRLAMLRAAGVEPVPVSPGDRLEGLGLLYIAGLEAASSAELARHAQAARVPVNVEDRPDLCDFHAPAIVRRGGLLLTVSTSGRAPGLASRLREWLERHFDASWDGRLDELSQARTLWRSQGVSAGEIAERTRRIIDQKGWLA